LAVVVFAPAVGFAEPAAPRVSVSRKSQSAVMALRAEQLIVSQTLKPGVVDVILSDGVDRVRVVSEIDGDVRIERAGRVRAFNVTSATAGDAAAAMALLGESPAVAAFEALLASPWGETRRALPFASSHALIALLQARTEPLRVVVQRIRTSSSARIREAGMTAGECWTAYERDAVRYTYELEQCIADASNSLNPLRVSWCAYSYNLKSTLAFIWLLDCSGY
jgi:hypothetical protein